MRINLKLLLLIYLNVFSFVAFADEKKPYYIELSSGFSNGYIPYNEGMPSGRYGSANVSSIALGYQFSDRIAFDLDFSYRGKFTNNDGSLSNNGNEDMSVGTSIYSLSTMINGYYYYYNGYKGFRPYITGGVGVAMNKTGGLTTSFIDEDGDDCSITSGGEKTVNFAWKVGTGVKYELNDSFEFDLRYQFVNLGNVKQADSVSQYCNGEHIGSMNGITKSSSLRSHEILVGVVFKF